MRLLFQVVPHFNWGAAPFCLFPIGRRALRKAFTLIELLVVISIIAVLLAILLPVLKNVRYSSRTTQCASNLRQVGIGTTAYAVDNDSRYPHKVGPIKDRYLNAIDGEYYRWEEKPWNIRENSRWDLIPMVEPYFSDLNEIFLCPHIAPDWDGNIYAPSTNATNIPYNMYWGITGAGANPRGVRVPMTKVGEGWGPGTQTDGDGITRDSRYRVLASDFIRKFNFAPPGRRYEGNHPPTGGNYEFVERANADGTAYAYSENTVGNANFLYDDGSVVLYGNIYQATVGEFGEYREGTRWIVPVDRVQK